MKHSKSLKVLICCIFFLPFFRFSLYPCFLPLPVHLTSYFKDFLWKHFLRTGSALGAVLKGMALGLGLQVVQIINSKQVFLRSMHDCLGSICIILPDCFSLLMYVSIYGSVLSALLLPLLFSPTVGTYHP